jgi:penicillin-binding protein-related factor A (putative recombinase)
MTDVHKKLMTLYGPDPEMEKAYKAGADEAQKMSDLYEKCEYESKLREFSKSIPKEAIEEMIEEINFGLDKTRRFLDMILKYGAEK